MQPASAEDVLDMIISQQLMTFITQGAVDSRMPKQHAGAFRSVLDEAERAADGQDQPLSLEQMQLYGNQLRVALKSRNLPPVPSTASLSSDAKTAEKLQQLGFLPDPKWSAVDARIGERLRALVYLDEKTTKKRPPDPPDKRGRGRGPTWPCRPCRPHGRPRREKWQ